MTIMLASFIFVQLVISTANGELGKNVSFFREKEVKEQLVVC